MVTPESVAQKLPPVNCELSLSGSFAEIRKAHFHAGVDFRTGGVIGKQVIAVDDGYVSRVVVSPVGYGKAIYLNHPDGTTSVYAHLERFDARISEVVRTRQYQESSFAVDFMPEDTIYYSQGDVIALSGNSGSSGGPHLHFEIRDTKSEVVRNSAHYIKVSDGIAPDIRGLYIYELDIYGAERRRGAFSLTKDGNHYTRPRLSVPAGLFGVGVDVVDRMEGSTAKLGLYRLEVYADGNLISSYVADSITFEQNKCVNVVGDYEAYTNGRKTLYKTFGSHWNSVYGCSAEFDGYVGVEQDSIVEVKVVCSDYNGNVSTLEFDVLGEASKMVEYDGVLWHAEEDNMVRIGNCVLSVGKGSLIRNVPVSPKFSFNEEQQSVIYTFVTQEEPLLVNGRVVVLGAYDKRTVVCTVDKKGVRRPLKSEWYEDSIVALTSTLGRYGVMVDTVPPAVRYRGVWRKGLSFYVADTHMSVQDISVFVNGVWTLYDYDAKSGTVIVVPDEPSFIKGENRIEVRAMDVVGNDSTLLTIYNKV